MAFTHGKDAVFWLDASPGGSLTNISAYVDNVDFSNSVDMAETSTFTVEAKTYISGLSDATLSISGKYDSTAVSGPDVILNANVGGEVTSTFEYGPEGGTSGKVKYSGEVFLTGYAIGSPVGDVVTFTADFQVSGAITRGTFV